MYERKRKPYVYVLIGVAGLWIASKTFTYLTHTTPPVFICEGIGNNTTVAGMLACTIKGDTTYPVYGLEVLLDNKKLAVAGADRIKAKVFEVPIDIDTTQLTDGPHELKIIAVDTSYNKNKTIIKCPFTADNQPLEASFASPQFKVHQGRTIHVKIKTNKRLAEAKMCFLGKEYPCYPESSYNHTTYESFIPISYAETEHLTVLEAEVRDAANNRATLTSHVEIMPYDFPKQKGFTVSAEKVSEERKLSLSSRSFEDTMEKLTTTSPKQKLWSGNFIMPTHVKKISTPHGEIRCTPERGHHQHAGIDLVNTPKAVVWSAARGKVVVMERYLLTGNTVVLDHGHGVFTLYAHLQDFAPDLQLGDIIRQGAPLGRIGMTGYANAHHLHFEVLVNNISVDPQEWCKPVG